MVYFCAWGPGCERFHDIVDEIIADDGVSGRNRFLPPTSDDVVMTTWHAHETLEEALDYFATCTLPTGGYIADSDYRVLVCIGPPEWAATARRFMRQAPYLI